MVRRMQKALISESDILKSEVEGRTYPVDMLKDLFVKSGMSSKRISQKYSIPLPKLLEYSEKFDWVRQKEDYDRLRINEAFQFREDSFLEHMASDQREQVLKLAQRNQELAEVEAYQKKHGHLFCVDEDGHVLLNKITGLPIKMTFGSSKEELQERRELQASVELNVKLMTDGRKEPPILVRAITQESVSPKLLEASEQLAESVFEEEDQ